MSTIFRSLSSHSPLPHHTKSPAGVGKAVHLAEYTLLPGCLIRVRIGAKNQNKIHGVAALMFAKPKMLCGLLSAGTISSHSIHITWAARPAQEWDVFQFLLAVSSLVNSDWLVAFFLKGEGYGCNLTSTCLRLLGPSFILAIGNFLLVVIKAVSMLRRTSFHFFKKSSFQPL